MHIHLLLKNESRHLHIILHWFKNKFGTSIYLMSLILLLLLFVCCCCCCCWWWCCCCCCCCSFCCCCCCRFCCCWCKVAQFFLLSRKSLFVFLSLKGWMKMSIEIDMEWEKKEWVDKLDSQFISFTDVVAAVVVVVVEKVTVVMICQFLQVLESVLPNFDFFVFLTFIVKLECL